MVPPAGFELLTETPVLAWRPPKTSHFVPLVVPPPRLSYPQAKNNRAWPHIAPGDRALRSSRQKGHVRRQFFLFELVPLDTPVAMNSNTTCFAWTIVFTIHVYTPSPHTSVDEYPRMLESANEVHSCFNLSSQAKVASLLA